MDRLAGRLTIYSHESVKYTLDYHQGTCSVRPMIRRLVGPARARACVCVCVCVFVSVCLSVYVSVWLCGCVGVSVCMGVRAPVCVFVLMS